MKAIINIEIVEHNNYTSFDKEINGENITECKKKTYLLTKENGPQDLMHKFVKKAFNKNITYSKHLCANCENMTKCEKVLDKEKKNLNAYSFITSAIKIVTIIPELQEAAKSMESYKDADNYDKDMDNDDKDMLSRVGKSIPSILVFNCENFVDDSNDERYKYCRECYTYDENKNNEECYSKNNKYPRHKKRHF